MEKYAFQKNLLELMVCNTQLEKVLEILKDEKLTFEFDNYFNVSGAYLDEYSITIETLFYNAVSTLEEINAAMSDAIEEIKQARKQ